MADETTGVMDAPSAIETDTSTSLDTGATSTDTTGTVSDATGTADAIDDGDSPQAGETGDLHGPELYRSVKDKLKNGEKLSTAEIRSIRKAIWQANEAHKATDGNLEGFLKQREIFSRLSDGDETLTPEQVVEQAIDFKNFWTSFDDKFQAGDASIVKQMAEANKDSFRALAPAVMDELSRVDNTRFSNYVARSAQSFLDSQGAAVNFAILNAFLPKIPDFPGKEQLVEAIQGIYGAYDGISKLASTKPEEIKVGGGQEDDKTASPAPDRELDITRREWNLNAGRPNVELRDSEMVRAAQARKMTLTEQEKGEIKAAVRDEFESRLAANRKYGEAMQGYIRSGNRRAYEERATSEGKKMLPGIVQRQTNFILDKRSQQKPAAAAKPNGSATKTVAQPAKDATGNLIQHLSAHPRTLGKRIDLNRTTHSMLERNRGYIVGEKPLYEWPQFRA